MLRAISVRQPWAWAIIHAGKSVENRTAIHSWRRAVGQTIGIHAAQRFDLDGMLTVFQLSGFMVLKAEAGALIGYVDVLDVHPANGCCEPWGQQYRTRRTGGHVEVLYDVCHLVLANPRPIEPIPMRGMLGLWRLPPDLSAVA